MLKFTIVLLYCSCYFCQVWNAPVIKASGVQWTEPKGNGKGNLTLIMIPQNNSCTNDTDMLIAVKSDYQVVSQDTQLLNLVINEQQNDTQNESNCIKNENQTKGINVSNPNVRENQGYKVNQTDEYENPNNTINKLLYSPNINTNNIAGLNKSICTTDSDIQVKQMNSLNPDVGGNQDYKVEQTVGCEKPNNTRNEILYSPNINTNNIGGLNKSTCTTDSDIQVKQFNSLNPNIGGIQDYKVEQTVACEKPNNTGNEILYSLNRYTDNMGALNKFTCSDNNNQNKQVNLNRYPLQNNIVNEITLKTDDSQKCTTELNMLICNGNENQMKTTNSPRLDSSINQGYKSDLINGCKTQGNNTGEGLLLNTNINQNNEINLSKDILIESQKTQIHPTDDYNREKVNHAVISNQTSGITDSIISADFLKLLNSVGEMEQHSELDAPKVPNNVNFYEAEKKNIPVQINEQNSSITVNENHLNSKESPNIVNENTLNLFKFLNAAQAKETTAASNATDVQNVFKFLSLAEPRLSSTQVLPSQVTPASTRKLSTRGFSTVNILKLLNISDHSGTTSLYSINNKNSNSQLFSDKEINIFKFLNISEPNVDAKLKKINEGHIINSTPSDLNSVYKVLSEALNITGKLNQVPHKAERILRSDTLPGNQVEELSALEGVIDTKGKISNGDYVVPASEEMLPKKVNLVNLNKFAKSKAEGSFNSGDSEFNSSVLTTCYVVDCDLNSENGISLETPSVVPQGARENTATVVYNTAEVTTVSPPALTVPSVTISPTCRTSIIYICNPEINSGDLVQVSEMVQEMVSTTTKPQAAMQELPKKVTLVPGANCDSNISSKQSLDTTTVSNAQQNQEAHFKEKVAYPLVESSLFLANNNEMPKGKSVPILLNTSSDYMMDLFLSDKDKLAKFHGNPSELSVNEEIVGVPRKMGRAKNKKKKIISIKNSALRENEQAVHPGQVVKMQFAGKNIIVEQMPSYRSEKFNKNCGSTPNGEPPSDEMEPDSEENEVVSRTKASKGTKPTIEIKSTYEQTESSESTYVQVTTQIISKQPDRTDNAKENENFTKGSSVSSTKTLTNQYETTTKPYEMQNLAKGPSKIQTTVEQPEGNEQTYSQAVTSQVEKTSRTDEESPKYVTECKTIKIINKDTTPLKKQTTSQDSQTESCNTLWGSAQNDGSTETAKKSATKTTTINIFGAEYTSQSTSVAPKTNGADQDSAEPYLMTDLITKSSASKSKSSIKNVEGKETSVGLYSITDQKCSQNVFIPGESVKEIVIQIIRNTKKPSNKFSTKSCHNYKEDDSSENENPNKNRYIQQPTVLPNKKIKPGGCDMKMSHVEKNKHEDIKYWYPELRKDEIEIGTIHKYNAYPCIGKMNALLDNTDMEKESTENIIAVTDIWSDANFKEFIQDANKNKKYLAYRAFKSLTENNNFNEINGT